MMPASDSNGCVDPSGANDSKEPVIDEPKARKKSWKKKFTYLLLFLLLLYPLSLLVINTPWAKSKLTNKLAEKTGLEWQVGSVIWVPFGNVYVNDIETVSYNDTDTGGITLSSISISPIWGKVIRGNPVWNKIHIDGVDLDIERSLLEDLLKNSPSSGQPQLKETVKQAPPVKVEPTKPDNPVPAVAKNPKPANPISQQPKEKKTLKKPIVPDKNIIVTGLNIKVSDQEKMLFQSNDITLDIPYAGKARNGSISIVDDSGEKENIPVIWDEKNVMINKSDMELLGAKIELRSRIHTLTKTPMFGYHVIIDDQPYEYELNRPNIHVKLKAERLQGQFIMSGSLLSPQTWNGFGGIEFKNFTIKETQKTMKVLAFDEVYARGRMMQGSLLLDDASARSDSLTFMANGVVRKDTYAYGILRCVANHTYSGELDRIYHGSRAIDVNLNTYSLFEQLNTPDRRYFDLYFDGKLTNLEYTHKRSNRWQSLNIFFKLLQKFKDDELREDGIFQP